MEKEFQDLFQIRHNNDRVEVGKVLIAEPFLEGKYFNRSVVYIVEHDDSGSVGFVLNKPLPYTASELVKELDGVYFPVYIGGPVERNQLYYIHRRNDIPDSVRIADGIYWGGDFKAVTEMLQAGKILQEEIRFFAGYSGWTETQLDNELKENSWMVGTISADVLFTVPNSGLWEQVMSSLGGKHKLWANFPEDPILN
ncbi:MULTISPECIES: YqgE/AlgH family protein [Butyricimonas]|uniref:UPF0301 protein H8S64_05855 n=1 Tax=Butyricimonas hominis TaxID=2763032 RepID=A0ABR7CY65_9BACT|nr:MULTISPECIES: YqgE/AlgH family protein [Butyricimonas]MBC5620618.1 YqgE/AlgH family protein [Butyricimonas hominis]MCB6970803.1 YqgE/AlgH family protein [Butyricimonas synergistica]MCG4517517.1 YqgE/AlgH family protein [Butyricimonas sp. DFI.6.44]